MESIQTSLQIANSGLSTVFQYDNIAIVVLMLCLCFSAGFNIIQMRRDIRKDREFRTDARLTLDMFLDVNKTLNSLVLAINTLNERIAHHD